MQSIQLPGEAYQLTEEYGLGEPIRMYRTDKRSAFKIVGCAILVTFVICIAAVLIGSHFHLSYKYIPFYAIFFMLSSWVY